MKLRNVPFSPPDMTEAEITEVANALRSGCITTGPRTKEFERLISMCCQTEKSVCLNSATACMELILRVLGVGPGDEVITSAYTYTASASVICHVGAKVVLVDTAPGTFEMDYDKLSQAITEKTKVIIPVDLGGVICDYDKIFAAIENYKHLFNPANDIQKAFGRIVVMADAAHAFGAQWHGRMCGEIADFTSFSFHAVKNLTTAEGGALTWRSISGIDNEWLYKQFQLLSLHGQNKDALAKTQLGAWEYDIIAPNSVFCHFDNNFVAFCHIHIQQAHDIKVAARRMIRIVMIEDLYIRILQRFVITTDYFPTSVQHFRITF